MYAIVEIQGQQFKAEAGRKLYVHRLPNEEGEKIEFDRVMLLDNEGVVSVGAPVIDGAKIVCEVLAHVKGEKVIIFKKKRRKGYRKRNGHRQQFTQIVINEIIA